MTLAIRGHPSSSCPGSGDLQSGCGSGLSSHWGRRHGVAALLSDGAVGTDLTSLGDPKTPHLEQKGPGSEHRAGSWGRSCSAPACHVAAGTAPKPVAPASDRLAGGSCTDKCSAPLGRRFGDAPGPYPSRDAVRGRSPVAALPPARPLQCSVAALWHAPHRGAGARGAWCGAGLAPRTLPQPSLSSALASASSETASPELSRVICGW